jgi:hypothetical protein|tara:strand:- start:602 stop:823 length:222 start_codon:yes stop_codon:yes gene_type:complete
MSEWIDFVKKVAKRDKIPYREALKKASSEYKKKGGKGDGTKKGERRKGAKMAGSRLAFDDTKQEKEKMKKEKK